MEDIHINKIWLKLQFGLAACIIAVGLLFAMIGNANATSITWQFDNTPQTVGPSDPVEMTISVTIMEENNCNPCIMITGFEISFIDPGTLIGQVDGISVDSTTNPYNLVLNGNGENGNADLTYNGTTSNITFGLLLPINGVAPFGTFTSGSGTTLTFFNFDNSYTTEIVGENTFTVNVVPEPSTMLLLGSGLAGLGFFRRRRKGEI